MLQPWSWRSAQNLSMRRDFEAVILKLFQSRLNVIIGYGSCPQGITISLFGGIPKASPKFGNVLEGLPGLPYSYLHSHDVLQWKNIKLSQCREKEVHGVSSGGIYVQASKGLLPVELHVFHFSSNEYCLPEKFTWAQESRVLMGVSHVDTLSLKKLQTSRRKASVQHKPHCLYK